MNTIFRTLILSLLSVTAATILSGCHEREVYTDGHPLSCELDVRAGYTAFKSVTKSVVVDKDSFTPIWEEGDKVLVYAFDKESGGQVIQIGTLTALSEGVETSLSGTLSFVYGDAVEGKIDMGDLSTGEILFLTPGDKQSLMEQKGKLEPLEKQSLYRTASGRVFTIDLEEKVLSLEGNLLRFSSPLSIMKLSLLDWKGAPVAPARLVVSALNKEGEPCLIQRTSVDGNANKGSVIVLADGLTNTYYVVLYPTQSGSLKYQVTATAGALTYQGTIGEYSLKAGHCYECSVMLNRTVDLSAIPSGFVAADHDVLKGTGTRQFTIADGAAVKFSGVALNLSEGIVCAGSARIILEDGTVNTITSTGGGILAGPQGSGLYISGGGELVVEAASTAIGGSSSRDCGHIFIESGTVKAFSGESTGAGIGSGKRHDCGNITISGGTVVAQGGAGAGIGSDEFGTCGSISITGGSVIARASERSAGIGTGDRGVCGNITITSGATRVEVTKGVAGDQCIGTGLKGICGAIVIDGVLSPTPESSFEHFVSQILEYRYVNDTWLLEKR